MGDWRRLALPRDALVPLLIRLNCRSDVGVDDGIIPAINTRHACSRRAFTVDPSTADLTFVEQPGLAVAGMRLHPTADCAFGHAQLVVGRPQPKNKLGRLD